MSISASLFLCVLATLFAVFEIEAEGKYGWAEKFPTWYRVNTLPARIYARFNNKPLTGYHAALFPVPLMIFLWPMAATSTWSLSGALAALGTYFGWSVIWDFAWFILNPHYGVRKFRKGQVWWFSDEPWLFARIPLSYCVAWTATIQFAALSGGLDGGWVASVLEQCVQLGVYLVFMVLLAVAGAPLFAWYYHTMRRPESDERDQADIFHRD